MADKDKPAGSEDGEPDKDAPRDGRAAQAGASEADARPDEDATAAPDTAGDLEADALRKAEAAQGTSEVEAQDELTDGTAPGDETPEAGASAVEATPDAAGAETPEADVRDEAADGGVTATPDTPTEAGASAVEAQPGPQIDDPAFADYARAETADTAETEADRETDLSQDASAGETVPPAPWAAAAGAAAAGMAGGAAADSSARAAAAGADEAPQTRTAEHPAREVVVKRGGFVPALLGGILAAVLGFAAARYVVPEGWPFPGAATPGFQETTQAALGEQAARIEALRADLAAAEPDLSPVEERIGDLESRSSEVAARLDDLSGTLGGRLSEIESRLTEIEKAPMEAALSQEAIEAYEQELQSLMDQVAAQRAEIEEIASEATSRDRQAAVAARRAEVLAALARITTAIDAGEPYAEALADLADAMEEPVPDGLQAGAQDGVPTRAELDSGFAPAARDALAAARDADAPPEDPADRFGAFLREQLGARSVAPREGDDADAVLSRAEAALRRGDLGAALDELAALPEPAQAELADWVTAARSRLAAVQAAERLNDTLNEE